MELVRKYKKSIVFLFILLSLSVILSLIIPKLTATYLNGFEKSVNYLFNIAVMSLMLVLSRALLDYIYGLLSANLFANLKFDLKKKLHRKIFNSNFKDMTAFSIGKLTETYGNDVDLVINYLSNVFVDMFVNALMIIGIVVISLITNIYLGLFIIAMSIISVILFDYINKRAQVIWQNEKQSREDFFSFLSEVFQVSKDLFYVGKVGYIYQKLEENIKKLNHNEFLSSLYGYHLWIGSLLTSNVAKILVAFVGGILVYRGQILIGSVFLFIYYIEMLENPIENLRVNLQDIGISKVSFSRIKEILNNDNEMEYGDKKFPENIKSIKFKDVVFSYEDKNVLRNFNLEINKGIIALVGRTGSGKSTIVKLISRLYDVNNGSILFNEIDVKEFKKSELSQNIEYISQNAFMDSFKFEELLGRDFDNILKKFDTNLHLNPNDRYYGRNYSAGMNQLIFLIKALNSDKKILLLDELTSEVDIDTEKKFFEILRQIHKDKIIIIITHKDFTINNCNRIVDMEEI